MSVPRKLLSSARSCRSMLLSRALASPSRARSRDLPPPPVMTHAGALQQLVNLNTDKIQEPNSPRNVHGTQFLLPAVLAGLFGAGAVEVAYADADKPVESPPLLSETPSGGAKLEEIARTERRRVEESLKSKGMHYGSYPRFSVGVKGQKVTLKFQVPPACEVSQLIANLVSNLGVKAEEHSGGSDMLLRGWDSAVAWQLMINPPERQREAEQEDRAENIKKQEGDLCILIFRSLISSDKAEIEFMKPGSLTSKELEAFVSVLQLAGKKLGRDKFLESRPREGTERKTTPEKAITSLESMGVRIYGIDEFPVDVENKKLSWDNIAGYEKQKREIEDTILLALHSPEVYDDIARGTRCKFESNRPRAVLFEGPPGTGKTSCARVIANQAGVPLLYVPLEIVLSKYYGESERLLGQVFSLANELLNGAIIFLDEVDSFAAARDSEMHEATRRILSVLLRQIDGFEQDKKVVVIAATNRKQDLDPALISRFDSMITFDLPDRWNRQEIAAQYAKHLTEPELVEFAKVTEGMSGRDIRDVCQQAERLWASKIIRGQANKDEQGILPPMQEYVWSAASRRNALLSVAEEMAGDSNTRKKKFQLDLS
ncbi:probable 26S proteasome regulatory subunit 10B isoform X1 [Rhodamnia argentea]|nr:probable 26S proteasome regulatory subunit 10B isoform X1 [Rhodamnia argentea]